MIAAAAGAGAPLSAMDGVLVAVKDELDCLPYPTTGKTTNFFFPREQDDELCQRDKTNTCAAIKFLRKTTRPH